MKHRYRKIKGVNYIEIILVISLLMILVAFGAPSLEKGKRQATTRAAAMTLVEDLRAARQRAMDTQTPIAVIIPSDGAKTAHANGYYIMEGFSNPKITKSVSWKERYPSSYIFVGFWDLTSGTNTITQPKPHANDFRIDMQEWGGDRKDKEDYVFLFTPRGTVKTNGLPNFDGNFHIAVTRGIDYTFPAPIAGDGTVVALDKAVGGGSSISKGRSGIETAFVDPVSTGKVNKAWMSSYTITVTPLGDVSLDGGLLKWSGTFETGNPPGGLMSNPSPAEPPLLSQTGGNKDPVILEVEILPHPMPKILTTTFSGADATSHVKFHNTLVIKARDIDGDDLFASVTCTRDPNTPAAPDSGWTFSVPVIKDVPMRRTKLDFHSGSVPEYEVMEPSNDENTHTLSVDWKSPPDSNSPHRYKIKVTVVDEKGGETDLTKSLGKDALVIEILPRDVIAYTRGSDICLMTPDGSVQRNITQNISWGVSFAAISPDCSKIALMGKGEVCVMNIDGSNLKQVTNMGITHPSQPNWSPCGTKILFGSHKRIYLINADGSHPDTGAALTPKDLTRSDYGTGDDWPRFSPDGEWISFGSDRFSEDPPYPPKIMVMDTNGNKIHALSSYPHHDHHSTWSPDGRYIVYNRYGAVPPSTDPDILWRIEIDWSGPYPKPKGPAERICAGWEPCFSPDGTRLIFGYDYDLYFVNFEDQSTWSNPTRLTDSSVYMRWPSWQRY
ncbi:MAG: hypothetical protein K8T10_05630 [Candidatus Eremiobacteraeota bacterium]|nr:hypothetical protein [Candidatus Eremiobacteraeota bacterium]